MRDSRAELRDSVADDSKSLLARQAAGSTPAVAADVRALQQVGDEAFRRLVESVHDYAIFLLSPRGTIVTWNAGAHRIKGYTASEAIGKHFSIFYTPEALAVDWPKEELRRSAEEGRFEDEGWRVRKDGSRFWANVVISPMFDSERRLIGFSKITRDLTERRDHENRLRVSERNLRLLVDGIQDYAIFTLDPDGVITSWNLGAQRIKGYSADEIIGRHFSIFYPPQARNVNWPQEELNRARAFGRFEDEGWRVRKDGGRIWANVVITAIVDEDGTLLGFSKVTRDLTERRAHEEELRERERNFRLLIDGVRDHAMFLLDRNGRIRTWNVGARRLLGYTDEDAIGRDIRTLYTEHDQASGRPTAELAGAARSAFLEVEGWRSKADGTQLWVEVSTTALFDSKHRLEGFVQIVRDLSARLRTEALESEGRRINEFIALLSHELRNPLAPIQNAVAVLKKVAINPDLQWCADVISRQTNHMKRLVDDLLDVSRITRGKIRIEEKPVDLTAVIAMAVDALRGTVAGRGHAITMHLPTTPLIVTGDATRLHQVMSNLLVNSMKFTPAQGRIDVSAVRRDAVAYVEITDTGIGMSESLLRHVFEPFVQGAHPLDRSESGLGIGLTLVKSIVELHGGTVSAASKGVDHGSTISLTLPLCESASHKSVDDATLPSPAVRKPTKVLIVDDNQDSADSLAMMLSLEGHDVHVANDGLQALALVEQIHPAVVVLDIGLPHMNGYEVARRLKSTQVNSDIRLIAVTGYGQEEDLRAASDAGFERHLTKPVDPAELSRAIG